LPPSRQQGASLKVGTARSIGQNCGREPSDAHHLRFAQPKALGRKVSDEFTVPVCRTHHREIHQHGNERTWWDARNIAPLPIAEALWTRSRPNRRSKPDGEQHPMR
jgi:hypothetical protein